MTKETAKPEKEIAVKSIMNQPVMMNVTNANLELLREKYAKIPDCTTSKGYELARVGISEIVSLRTSLAACKKEKKSDAIAFGKRVDAEYNRVLEVLIGIETPMKEAKKKVDAIKEAKKEEKRKAEENRKFKITNRINMIRELIFSAADKPSEDIKKQLDVVKGIEINKADFEEFKVEAERARIDVEVKLEDLYAKAVEREEAAVTMKAEEDRIAKERKDLEDAKIKNDAERDRIAGIENNIGLLKDLPFSYHESDSPAISLGITSLEAMEITETEYGEFIDEAAAIKIDVFNKLKTLKAQAEEKAELQKKQEELDEREKKADEECEAAAEEERLAKEKAEQEEKDKAAEQADEELQFRKYNESFVAIELLVEDREISKAVLDAVMDGVIPNVTYA